MFVFSSKRRFRLLSWVLVIVLLLDINVFTITTASAAGQNPITNEETASPEPTSDPDDPSPEPISDQDNPSPEPTSDKEEPSPEPTTEIKEDQLEIPDCLPKDGDLYEQHVDQLEEFDDEYTIVYENEDGTNTAYIFTDPIRYIDENGKLQLKDSSLIELPEEEKQQTGYKYKNKADEFDIYLPDNLSSNSPKIEFKDKYAIEYSFETKNDEKLEFGETTSTQEIKDSNEKIKAIDYATDLNDDIIINFSATDKGIKDEIILNRYTGENSFTFNVNLKGLIPGNQDNGYIELLDDKTSEVVAIIEPPFALDSYTGEYGEGDGHFTENINMNIEPVKGENTYSLTITVDEDFLKDERTVYPVKIDPTTSITYNYSSGMPGDTYICREVPNSAYNNSTHLRFGDDGSHLFRTLVKFDISSIVSNVYGVVSAEYRAYNDITYTTSAQARIHPILGTWQLTDTWNTINAKGSGFLGSSIIDPDILNHEGWYNLSIKTFVDAWVNYYHTSGSTGYANNGIMIREKDETDKYRRFISLDGSVSSERPTLTITYYTTDTFAPQTVSGFSLVSGSISGTVNSGYGHFSLKWNPGIDNNVGYKRAGIKQYNIQIKNSSGTVVKTLTVNDDGRTGQYTVSTGDLEDNKTYSAVITASDKASPSNTGSAVTITGIVIGDYSQPGKPTCNISTANPTKNTSPVITWSGITDQGNNLVYAQYRIDSGNWVDIGSQYGIANSSSTPFHLNCSSLTQGQHNIYIRGRDSVINYGIVSEPISFVIDTIVPEAAIASPQNESVVDGDCTVSFTASDTNLSRWILDYALGTDPQDTDYLPENGIASGTDQEDVYNVTWNTAELIENRMYTLRLRVFDTAHALKENPAEGNVTTIETHVLYSHDSQRINAGLAATTTQDGSSVTVGYTTNEGIPEVSNPVLYVNNEAQSGMTFDLLNYPEGSQVFYYVRAQDSEGNYYYSNTTFDGTREDDPTIKKLIDDFDGEGGTGIKSSPNLALLEGSYKLSAGQTEGSLTSNDIVINGYLSYVELAVNESKPAGTNITYKLYYGTGPTDFVLVTPGQKQFIDVQADTFNLVAEFSGTTVLSPELSFWSMDTRFMPYADAMIISNSFEKDRRGFTKLNGTVHDDIDENIELFKITALNEYVASGTVESTIRNTSADVVKVDLIVDETLEENTEIRYYISTNGGSSWQEINAFSTGENWQSQDVNGVDLIRGNSIKLKAELKSNDPSHTPHLNSWTLRVMLTTAGECMDVDLVDEPDMLSALPDANYMTLLRWKKSDSDTEEVTVTYNVYRNDNPYFEITDESVIKVAENIPDNYFSDFCSNDDDFNKTFYYKVTAVKDGRESLVSNEEWATVVAKNELSKRLGLQDYWGYSGFRTGSGTGYVNVDNGNLVYITTDIVVPGTAFGIVMRRTYNSQALTQTALGYGWDYSFNTRLLREIDSENNEISMVLKDGDGSFHRFEKLENGLYATAPGTFMSLEKVGAEYQIKRKDGITYHFDEDSLKLLYFSDENQNRLNFEYDERGNIHIITNEVGEKLILDYKLTETTPEDEDYTYVNDHIDMLDKVTWVQKNGGEDAATKIYSYTYTTDDKLEVMSTDFFDKNDQADTANCDYTESFGYIPDTLTDTTNFIIHDPMGYETTTILQGDGVIRAAGDGTVEKVILPTVHEPSEVTESFEFEYGVSGTGDGFTEVTRKVSTYPGNEGATITYTYDNNGLIKKKTDSQGNDIDYEYNDDFLVTHMHYQQDVYDIAGTPTTKDINCYYNYYTEQENGGKNIGDLKNIVAPRYINGTIALPTGATDSDNIVTQYTYANSNFPHKPTKIETRNQGSAFITTQLQYDSYGNLITTTDALGKQTTNSYAMKTVTVDGQQNSVRCLVSTKDRYGKVTKYFYDELLRLERTEEWIEKVSGSSTTLEKARDIAAYTYDDYGYTDVVTDAMGREVDFTFDILGRTMKTRYTNVTIDENGEEETYYTYETLEYDRNSNLIESTDRKGYLTSYHYDEMDRLYETVAPLDTVSSIKYGYRLEGGKVCDKVITTDPEGITKTDEYDVLGRLKKTVGGGSEMTYVYDNVGNVLSGTDKAGVTSIARYNELGHNTYNALGNMSTTYAYDNFGNVLTKKDAANNTLAYTYDVLNRLQTATDADNKTTKYEYDIIPSISAHDASISENVYIYNTVQGPYDAGQTPSGTLKITYLDQLGQKLLDVNQGKDSDTSTKIATRYEYNDDGSVKKVTFNDGTSEEYEYDSLGRLKFEYFTAAKDEYNEYEYDDNGNRILAKSVKKVVKPGQTYYNISATDWHYDALNRVDNYVQDGNVVNYEYYANSAIKAIKYSTVIGEEFVDTADRYTYDSYGRIIGIYYDTNLSDGNNGYLVRSYAYESNGRLDYTDTTRNNIGDSGSGFMRKDYIYNSTGMLWKLEYKEQGTTLKERYEYTYNNRGFIQNENKYTKYTIESKVTENTTSLVHNYDVVGRLLTTQEDYELKEDGSVEEDKETLTSYTYDAIGNRDTMTIDEEDEDLIQYDYVYDIFERNDYTNRKMGDEDWAMSEDYNYDTLGRTQWEKSYYIVDDENELVQEKTYTYYSSGELSKVSVDNKDVDGYPNQAIYTVDYYHYNADGQRILKESAETIKYYYSGSAVLFTSDPSNVKKSENVLTPGGEVISSKRFGDVQDGNKWFYFNYDNRGSTTVILSPDGSYKKDYYYDTFGNTEEGGGSFYNETQYTGAINDKSTGMYYMNARYYNPSTGRFLTQDKYSGNAYDPWTQNLYAYCGNNPVNFIDPTGYKWIYTYTGQKTWVDDYKGQGGPKKNDSTLQGYKDKRQMEQNRRANPELDFVLGLNDSINDSDAAIQDNLHDEWYKDVGQAVSGLKAEVNQKMEEGGEWTVAAGWEASAACALRLSAAEQFFLSSNGNFGLLDTLGIGFETNVSAFVGGKATVLGLAMKEEGWDLRGLSLSGSYTPFGGEIAYGGEFNFIIGEGQAVDGFSATGGWSQGFLPGSGTFEWNPVHVTIFGNFKNNIDIAMLRYAEYLAPPEYIPY